MNERNNKLELLGSAPIPKALMALGIPTVSYTHLDVYKRQDGYRRFARGTEHFAGTGCLLQHCCGLCAGLPVSYTHLDVYKRQVLSAGQAAAWAGHKTFAHQQGLCE